MVILLSNGTKNERYKMKRNEKSSSLMVREAHLHFFANRSAAAAAAMLEAILLCLMSFCLSVLLSANLVSCGELLASCLIIAPCLFDDDDCTE